MTIEQRDLARLGGRDDTHGKSAAEIEDEINRTRAELGAVLDALEHGLAPRQLLEKGVDMVKETLGGDGGIIGETLRNHPVPLALIGAGVGWLLVEATAGDRAAQVARQAGSRISDAAHALTAQTQETAGATVASLDQTSEELARYAYARTKPQVSAAVRSVDTAMSRARDTYRRVVADNPLALGLVGLLAGASMALLLPRSAAEERWLGTPAAKPAAGATGGAPTDAPVMPHAGVPGET
jgi:hypothetical protein